MTASQGNERIDQIYFGWSHDGVELGVLATSFNEPDERRWLGILQDHIRLEQVPGTKLPPHAWSMLHCDGNVALLRRTRDGFSSGRTDSHALIGPAAALDATVALGLTGWKGWQDKPPGDRWMPMLASQTLANAADLKPLHTGVLRREHDLGVVLARLLESPHAPLSIIGCPDEDRLAMVWGLRAAVDSYLHRHGITRHWTFSTYEDQHDVHVRGLPEVVFLPTWPASAAEVHRVIVDLDGEPPIGPHAEFARDLVAQFLHGTPAPATPQRHEEPGRQPVAVSVGAARHDNEHEQPTGPTPPAGSGPPNPGLATAAPQQAGYNGRSGRRDAAQNPSPVVRVAQQAWSTGQKSVAALLRAKTVWEFDAALQTLESQEQHRRRQLRDALDLTAVDHIVYFVEISAREKLLGRLLRAMYGPAMEDLAQPDAHKHAAKLITRGESHQLAMMLGRFASAHGGGRLRDLAVQRWETAGDAGVVLPTGLATRALRLRRRNRYLPAAAALTALFLLVVVFLLGRAAGSSGSALARDTTTTPPATVQPGGLLPDASGLVSSGQAAITPGENMTIYAFVRIGNAYQPQSPCSPRDQIGWVCQVRPNPPTGQGTHPVLVAVEVPRDEQPELNNLAEHRRFIDSRRDTWGQEVPVRA